jgi:hypothetical protein
MAMEQLQRNEGQMHDQQALEADAGVEIMAEAGGDNTGAIPLQNLQVSVYTCA